jgi:serine/threonine protein kinase
VTNESTEDRLLGKTIADAYHLVEIRGRGAFGTVFKAHQYFCKQFVRPVAVKVSRQAGLTSTNAAYLFSDALMLAQIQAGGPRAGKEHLVPIYAMGLLPEEEGRGYLVMEFVDGHPLLSHMQAAGRIGVATGLRYIKEICRGLAVMHAQGALHRDLKPDNVLIDRAGVVRLVDFGLATFTDPRLGFAPGSMGTFTYMAPETMRGRSTAAADVYGVGLILYELFTGGGPHLTAPWPRGDKEEHWQENSRIKESLVFPPPSAVQNEIRHDYPWLDKLIARCLAVDESQRFRDARQLLAAIEACQAGDTGVLDVVGRAGLPADTAADKNVRPTPQPAECDALFRDIRRLLGQREYVQVIDRLDVHRPAEWAALDVKGATILRYLGQAYLGRGDLPAARDCLEQLRDAQKEQHLLAHQDFAAALSDLVKCYRALGRPELADTCQQEARRIQQGA